MDFSSNSSELRPLEFLDQRHSAPLPLPKEPEEHEVMETKTSPRETWYCYILRNRHPKYAHLTYNGSTNNPRRRLRQHNEEISGGARFTHGRGGGWENYVLLTGFPDHKNALSCEWRIKHPNGKPGKRPPEHCGVRGRAMSMNHVLHLDKWTQQCLHNNREQQFTLYLAKDVISCVDIENLPANVTFGGDIPCFA